PGLHRRVRRTPHPRLLLTPLGAGSPEHASRHYFLNAEYPRTFAWQFAQRAPSREADTDQRPESGGAEEDRAASGDESSRGDRQEQSRKEAQGGTDHETDRDQAPRPRSHRLGLSAD